MRGVCIGLSVVFFCAQSLSWATPLDFRHLIADRLQESGIYYQALSETEGMDKAKEMFLKDFQKFNQNSLEHLGTLSEQEVESALNDLGLYLPSDEKIVATLSDRSLTSRQKLMKIYQRMSQEKFSKFVSEFQETTNQVGFEKAFSELAQTFRARYILASDSPAQKEFERTFSDIVRDHERSYNVGDQPLRLTHEGKVFLWTVGIGFALLFVGEAISPGVGRVAYGLMFILFIYWFLNWTYGYTV